MFVPERWIFRLFYSVHLVTAHSFTVLPFHSSSINHCSRPLVLYNLCSAIQNYRNVRLQSVHGLTQRQMCVCIEVIHYRWCYFMSTACDIHVLLSAVCFDVNSFFLGPHNIISTPASCLNHEFVISDGGGEKCM